VVERPPKLTSLIGPSKSDRAFLYGLIGISERTILTRPGIKIHKKDFMYLENVFEVDWVRDIQTRNQCALEKD
jgi:hypothetical protein